jgi:hypothetical protein
MSDMVKEAIDATSTYAGWTVALLTATWGFTLRVIIGRSLRSADNTQLRLSAIEQRLAVIEDRSHQKRKGDR